ncbi:MAG: hypothetical protein GC181_16290 [Bacteroidetes bacterium]|nr:hypothetical protein [Bacteroidota bacterium]
MRTLKTTSLLFTALLMMGVISSCDELNKLGITLDKLTQSATTTIDPTSASDTTYVTVSDSFSLDDFKQDIEDAGYTYDKNKLDELKIVSIHSELINPAGGNFNWGKSAKVEIRSANHPDLQTVANIDDLADDLTFYDYTVNPDDIAPQLKDDWFQFVLTTSTDAPILVQHKVKSTFTYSMKVKP